MMSFSKKKNPISLNIFSVREKINGIDKFISTKVIKNGMNLKKEEKNTPKL